MSVTTREPSELERAFDEFHAQNPHVYAAFKRFTLEAIRSGRKRIGVAMIWERMRWHASIETSDADFKLNNNHRAYYARLFMLEHPRFGALFETRRVKAGDPVPDGTQLEFT